MKISVVGLTSSMLLLIVQGIDAKDLYSPRSLTSCRDFPSVDEIKETLLDLETQYPEVARRFEIGTSVEGRTLHGIRLSQDPDEETLEPEVRIIGGIHGNECMGALMCLLTAEWLAGEYGDDAFVTRLLENAEIAVLPLVDPDGYSAEPASRLNARGVDLNRNLYFAWVGDGASPFSEPETRALRDFSLDNDFTLGISYHTVSYYVNSPWNYTPYHPPDEALFQAIGEGYAGTSTYQTVFGWDWYNIQGDVNDWSLGTNGTFDWTLELLSDTDSGWPINREGLEGFLSFVFQGVQGIVRDATTEEPLLARISIQPKGAPVFTDEDVGDFNRLLLPGTYDITAYVPGYEAMTVNDVKVIAGEMTRLDFSLHPQADATAYAFKIDGMSLPRPIPTSQFNWATQPYLNETAVWEALGAPDNRAYSLSSGDTVGDNPNPSLDLSEAIGSITLDMGESTPVRNQDGMDFRVVSATVSDEKVAVLVSDDRDGPFVWVSTLSGTFDVDIENTGFSKIRFVRLVDVNDGPFNDPSSGYDVDAVINLTVGRTLPADTDLPDDTGDDGLIEAVSGGCTCQFALGRTPRKNATFWTRCLLGRTAE